MSIRVVLVEDHLVVRSGLRLLLEHNPEIEIVGEAGNAAEALEVIRKTSPHVVLMDIGLPDRSGIDVTREVKRYFPNVAVLALTIHEDEEYFFKMLEAGASGYVPKRAAPEELLAAIRTAASGEVYIYPSLAKLLVQDYLRVHSLKDETQFNELTPREREVLALLAEGASNEEIAAALVISPKTVERHRENIMRKLNLHSRAELVRYAIRKGIIRA
ncbi:MAG: response regulator transcription factor [Anaerolineales bacterium]